MSLSYLWILSLPIAAASGWFAALKSRDSLNKKHKKYKKSIIPHDYLVGLNFLLNEEHDKALNVFIRMLEVDSDTVETHLALGNLFRRRGEVDRAIRIHQNIIARPNLEKDYRTQALLSLAKDYLSAGVLDRAERLFLELINLAAHVEESSLHLLDIYQREHEWQKAIDIAAKLGDKMHIAIAHYYCELAENSLQDGDSTQASKYLKRALMVDSCCARASLLLAKLASIAGNHKQAICHLQHIKEQNVAFFSETILPLAQSYRALAKEKELVTYFGKILKEIPKLPIAVILAEEIRQWRGDKVAANFVADYVRKHPSVAGVHRLVELHLALTEGKAKNDLLILHRLTKRLLDEHLPYQCINCGFSAKKIHWQCPSCKNWSTIRPTHALEE
jgi:lipopolysaccharide biosynthesis regulator YciM